MEKEIKVYNKQEDVPTVKGKVTQAIVKVSHPVLENINVKKGDRIDIVPYLYDGNWLEDAMVIEPTKSFKGVNRPETLHEMHGTVQDYAWVTSDGREYSGNQIYNWTGKSLPDFLEKI
jgi:hypothetical protein